MSDMLKNMGMLRGPIAIPVDPTLIGKIICGEGFNPKEMPSSEDALKNFFCSMSDGCEQEVGVTVDDGCDEDCCDDCNYEIYANAEIEDDPEFVASFFGTKDCTKNNTENKNDELSVLLYSGVVETLEEKTNFVNYVSELNSMIEGRQDVSIIIDVVPIKDGDGNHRILEGCEDVFLGLLKSNRPKSDFRLFLVAECSVIVKIK